MQADCFEVFHPNSPALALARRACSPAVVHLSLMLAYNKLLGRNAPDFVNFAGSQMLIAHDAQLRSN